MIKVFLIDDHPLLLESIAALIEENGECTVVGKSSKAELGVIDEIYASACDVLVQDVSMPNMDAFELIPLIKERLPDLSVIIYTMHSIERYYKHFLSLGVDGYVVKSSDTGNLIDAIHCVFNGSQYFPSSILSLIANADKAVEENQLQFTKFEKQILAELRLFKTNNEISKNLNCEQEKVLAARKNLLVKTGTSSTHDLLKLILHV